MYQFCLLKKSVDVRDSEMKAFTFVNPSVCRSLTKWR